MSPPQNNRSLVEYKVDELIEKVDRLEQQTKSLVVAVSVARWVSPIVVALLVATLLKLLSLLFD